MVATAIDSYPTLVSTGTCPPGMPGINSCTQADICGCFSLGTHLITFMLKTANFSGHQHTFRCSMHVAARYCTATLQAFLSSKPSTCHSQLGLSLTFTMSGCPMRGKTPGHPAFRSIKRPRQPCLLSVGLIFNPSCRTIHSILFRANAPGRMTREVRNASVLPDAVHSQPASLTASLLLLSL